MKSFFMCWVLSLGSLTATLILLSVVYRLRDADLGLGAVRREAIIAAVVFLLQAAVLSASVALLGWIHGRVLIVAGIVGFLGYRLTHATSNLFEGTSEMDSWQAGAIAVTQVGLIVCGYVLLQILIGR